jgi:replicative DNA helicase
MEHKLPDDAVEPLIIKGMLQDTKYLSLLLKPFEDDYFDNPTYKDAFKLIKDYYISHHTIPDQYILKNMIPDYDSIASIEFSVENNIDYLITETNRYMKEKAIKKAIMESVDIIEKDGDLSIIRENVSNALAKDLNLDIGLNYWSTIIDRMKMIGMLHEKRVPTGFPILDEFINGGLLPYTLSLFLSRIHGFKTTLLINIMQRLSVNGKNVIFFSMEMSETEIAKRMDSITTLYDINKMYSSKDHIKNIAKKLVEAKKDKGIVVIKEFPTGQATVSDLKSVLKEYQYRGIEFDVIMCDYVTIMKPERAKGELYKDGKAISEELRALSGEFNAPMVSVSQLNRSGIEIDFREVDLTHIGECLSPTSLIDHKVKGKVLLSDIQVGDLIENNEGYVEVMSKSKTKKKKFIIKTRSGKCIECSKDHIFPTDKGDMSIKSGLKVNENLYIKNNVKDEIIEIIETDEYIEMIDIGVSGNHLFYANDILTHNSLGISATCDFLAIMGRNQEDLVYESELHYKIVKNRMGGRVNEMGKFYIDKKCLKMYDESELDTWIHDVKTTGDERKQRNNY